MFYNSILAANNVPCTVFNTPCGADVMKLVRELQLTLFYGELRRADPELRRADIHLIYDGCGANVEQQRGGRLR